MMTNFLVMVEAALLPFPNPMLLLLQPAQLVDFGEVEG